jgi:hypothetical protein
MLQYLHAIANTTTSSAKGLRSTVTLISWEILKEWKPRGFNFKASMVTVFFKKNIFSTFL